MKLSLGIPNRRQKEFFLATNRYIAYGGARGGGKSWAVRRKALLLALRYPKIKILIVRRSYGELRENHIRPLCMDASKIADYRETDKTLKFRNGSIIFFGFCGCPADVDRYQGMEFDVIFLDEATQFQEEVFDALRVCIRGVNDFPKRFYLTCNPGGIGHGWVKRLFIQKQYRSGENAGDYLFIPAKVYDNTALMKFNPEYVAHLQSLPEARRKAWLDGDWDVFAGQFFQEFDDAVHMVKDFSVPKEWKRFRVFDYGLDRLACLWIAIDFNGDAWVYDEYCESNLIVSEAAEKILAHNTDEVVCTLAPIDLWGRSQESGRSRAEIFATNGVILTKVRSERIAGWMNVREWLKVEPQADGSIHTRLHIFQRCQELRHCLPAVQFASGGVEDMANEPHELTHVLDALRYFCVWKSAVVEETHDQLRENGLEWEQEEEQIENFWNFGR